MQFFYTNTEGTSYGRPEGLPSVVPSRFLSAKKLGFYPLDTLLESAML